MTDVSKVAYLELVATRGETFAQATLFAVSCRAYVNMLQVVGGPDDDDRQCLVNSFIETSKQALVVILAADSDKLLDVLAEADRFIRMTMTEPPTPTAH